MSRPLTGTNLYRALLDEGFSLPENCGDVMLEMPVNGRIQLHCAIHVSGEDLAKLGRALARLGDEAKRQPVVTYFPELSSGSHPPDSNEFSGQGRYGKA